MDIDGLSTRDQRILDFETRHYRHPGAKEVDVRETFDLSPTRYHQILNALLDDPAAEAAAPQLVHRLQRLRDARRATRTR